MNNEIKELFPKEFYIKKDKKMYAEISLENLNKIADCITNLQEENKRLKEYQESYRKELDYWRIQFSNKEERIDKARGMIRFIAYNSERPLTITELNKVYNILGGDDNATNSK